MYLLEMKHMAITLITECNSRCLKSKISFSEKKHFEVQHRGETFFNFQKKKSQTHKAWKFAGNYKQCILNFSTKQVPFLMSFLWLKCEILPFL